MSEETLVTSAGLTTSAEIGQLAKALAEAHKDFKPVIKDSDNPFFKSKYADLAGAIEATSAALSKNGLVVIQSPRLTQNRVAVTTLLAHSSGQWLRDELEMPLAKFDAQGTGSAITYARRYAYLAIVGVAAEDDDGNAASQKFDKQPDGSFSKRTESVQPAAPKKPGRPPAKTKQTDFPHGHNAPAPAREQTAQDSAPVSSNAITPDNPITDNDLPDNLQGTRLPTEEEAKGFRERLIKIKDKGYAGLGQWILKKSGKPRTQDIPYSEIARIVDEVEKAEAAGNLKALLSN